MKDGDKTTWKEREAEWHDVFVFRPAAAKIAGELKKGDKVAVSGSISYRLFKDEKGKGRKQAFINGHFIEKIEFNRQESGITQEFVDELVEG